MPEARPLRSKVRSKVRSRIRSRALGRATGRSTRFLRTSTMLMTLVTVLALVVMTYVELAYANQRSDFANNRNLKIISVKHKDASSGRFGQLALEDSERISDLLTSKRASNRQGIVVSNRYELGTAVETSGGRSMFVYGFDPAFAPALGLADIADGVGYTIEGGAGETDLRVAVVTVGKDGYTSGSIVPQHVSLRGVLKRYQIDYLLGGAPGNSMIVNTATFAKIATTMYAMDWQDLRRSWQRGELPMTPLLGAVAVYVPNLGGVRPAARLLQRAGYRVDYGLRAFDDLARSLRQSTALAAGLVVLFLIATGGYVLVSWRSYLRLSRRDIGILKHWGIPPAWIAAGYSRRLLRTCLLASCACLVAGLAAGVATFGLSPGLGIGLINWGFVSGILLAMWKVASRIVVDRQVAVDTLALLTRQREFQ